MNSRPLDGRGLAEVLHLWAGLGGWCNEPDEPQEALRRGVLLRLQLVPAEVLDVFRLGGSGELPFADFLGYG